MEIRRGINELLSWSKQDEDPFKNSEQDDEGGSTSDFSSVHGKGEACHDARDEKVPKASVVLTKVQPSHQDTHLSGLSFSVTLCLYLANGGRSFVCLGSRTIN